MLLLFNKYCISSFFIYGQACSEYAKAAQTQGKKWHKAIQYEKEQRQRLEKVVEELAKQHTKLEEAAVASGHGIIDYESIDIL